METVLQTLCRGELRAVETRALVMNRSRKTSHEVVDGVPVTRVGSPLTVGAVAVAPTLPLWLARAEADLVVLHEPNPMALLAYFLARPKAPLIVWYHSEVVRPGWRYRLFYRPLLEFALRRAARVVVASPPMKDVPALAALSREMRRHPIRAGRRSISAHRRRGAREQTRCVHAHAADPAVCRPTGAVQGTRGAAPRVARAGGAAR